MKKTSSSRLKAWIFFTKRELHVLEIRFFITLLGDTKLVKPMEICWFIMSFWLWNHFVINHLNWLWISHILARTIGEFLFYFSCFFFSCQFWNFFCFHLALILEIFEFSRQIFFYVKKKLIFAPNIIFLLFVKLIFFFEMFELFFLLDWLFKHIWIFAPKSCCFFFSNFENLSFLG